MFYKYCILDALCSGWCELYAYGNDNGVVTGKWQNNKHKITEKVLDAISSRIIFMYLFVSSVSRICMSNQLFLFEKGK